MGVSSTNKIRSCPNCDSERLRSYGSSFGSGPIKYHIQCLDCAWSKEVMKPRKNPPKHYDRGLEPWDVISAWGLDFWEGNAIKYICRAGRKENNTAVEDYEKAITYLEECKRKAQEDDGIQ
mgnify:CR=1 FL=1